MRKTIKHGFLEDEYNEQYESIRKKYRSILKLAKDTNHLAHDVYFEFHNLSIDPDDLRKLLVTILFAKAMSHFQGIYILVKKGMNKEGNCLLRVLLETCLWIIAIDKHENLHLSYMLSSEKERFKFFETIKKYRPGCHDIFKNPEQLDEAIDKTKDGIIDICNRFNINNKRIELYEIAELAQIPDTYMVLYSLLSHDIHSNSLSIDSYVSLNEAGITTITYGPKDEEITRIFSLAIGIFNQAITSVSHLLEMDSHIAKRNNVIQSILQKDYNSDKLFRTSLS